jgi:hypothetical protein
MTDYWRSFLSIIEGTIRMTDNIFVMLIAALICAHEASPVDKQVASLP